MRVDVSGRMFCFPRSCVCCGAEPDAQLRISASKSRGKRVVHTTTHWWDVPCCSRCLAHQHTWAQADTSFNAVLGLGAIFLVFLTFTTCAGGLVAFSVALLIGLLVRGRGRRKALAQCSSACAAPTPTARFTGWDGSFHCFEFDSREYCGAFMVANSGKLVNVTPGGHQVLEAALGRKRGELETRRAHLLEEHKAAVAEDEDYLRWIARIEGARGAASRRAAKEAALRALSRDDLRQRLICEAARIEVQAAFDKADGLKTSAAKLRTLRAAIEAVRAEDVPAEFQSSQVEALEEAIAHIERSA